jgi:hypothetical protein
VCPCLNLWSEHNLISQSGHFSVGVLPHIKNYKDLLETIDYYNKCRFYKSLADMHTSIPMTLNMRPVEMFEVNVSEIEE